MTLMGAALDREDSRDPGHLGVGQGQEPLEIATVERIYSPPVELNVRL
jgi:hypothetical protein